MQHYRAGIDKVLGLTEYRGTLTISPVLISDLISSGIDFTVKKLAEGVRLTNYYDLILAPQDLTTFTTDKIGTKVNHVFLGKTYRFIAVYDLVNDCHECTVENRGSQVILELFPYKHFNQLSTEVPNFIGLQVGSVTSEVIGDSIRWSIVAEYKGNVEYQTTGYYFINYIKGSAVRVECPLIVDIDFAWDEFILIPFIKKNKEYLGHYKIVSNA